MLFIFLVSIDGKQSLAGEQQIPALSSVPEESRLGIRITASGAERGGTPLRSAQLVFPCVDCGENKCSRTEEAGAFGRSQILDSPSPSNNNRGGERLRGLLRSEKCHLASRDSFVSSEEKMFFD